MNNSKIVGYSLFFVSGKTQRSWKSIAEQKTGLFQKKKYVFLKKGFYIFPTWIEAQNAVLYFVDSSPRYKKLKDKFKIFGMYQDQN